MEMVLRQRKKYIFDMITKYLQTCDIFCVMSKKNEELCVCLTIETIIREDNMLGDILIYASNGCL